MDFSSDSRTSAEAHTTAVQKLFLQYQPAIRGYILSIIPDFTMAEDVMQETFLVVTKKAAAFELGTSFTAWVKAIARFKSLEAIRANRHRGEFLSEEVLDALGTDRAEFRDNIDERLALLATCVEQLAPQAKRSIVYRYRNDHLPPEIAALMGCTVQSVNVTLARARVFLRDCVNRRLSTSSSPS